MANDHLNGLCSQIGHILSHPIDLFICLLRLRAAQKSKFFDWCDIEISLAMEKSSSTSSHVHRKWTLLVGGPENQLIFSFRGSDALLGTAWSRLVRVNARYDSVR